AMTSAIVSRPSGLPPAGPDPQRLQLSGRQLGPVAIGRRAGGTGMQNTAKPERAVCKNVGSALEGEIPNRDEPFGSEGLGGCPQVFVTGGEQRGLFGRGKFVGGAVAAAALDEDERAVVEHDMLQGESFW